MFKAPFSFEGRIRRIEYFLSSIISGVITGVVYSVCLVSLFVSVGTGSVGGSAFSVILGFAALIAAVWFGLAQGVKRLHDLDKSGWLILIFLIPIVGAIFGLYMLFADGTVGPNQYGLDPKNRAPYQQQASSVNVTVNVHRETEEVKVEQTPKTDE